MLRMLRGILYENTDNLLGYGLRLEPFPQGTSLSKDKQTSIDLCEGAFPLRLVSNTNSLLVNMLVASRYGLAVLLNSNH